MEEATLLFKHLPAELTMDERKDLLHYLGAIRVQIMSSTGSMKNSAFAVFQNKEEASKIVKQLHQVEFLGSKLKVEFAHKNKPRVASVVDNEGTENKQDQDQGSSKNDAKTSKMPELKEIKFDETFQVWGVKHQRRPDLCYLYPPPTPSTLTNIMHTLAAVPKFYVQVLHLMNKMDLPAPFGAVTSAPPVHPDKWGYVVTDDAVLQEMDISSGTESELESDEEEKSTRSKDQVQVKRPLKNKTKHQRKRPRLTDLKDAVNPQPDVPSGETPLLSEVFEQASSENVAAGRKIELRLPSHTLPPKSPHPHPTTSQYPSPLEPYSQPLAVSAQTGHWSQSDKPMDGPHERGRIEQSTSSQHRPSAELNLNGAQADPPGPSQQQVSLLLSLQQQPEEANVTATVQPGAGTDNPYDVPLPPQHHREIQLDSLQNKDLCQETVLGSGGQPVVPQASAIEGEHQQEQAAGGGFGILQPQPQPKEHGSPEEGTEEKEWTRSKFISSSELKHSRLSHSEMKEYSVFRRYNQGDPSCRLYIKNLAKQVTEEDIHWIFGRYVDWDDPTEKFRFDIRLMKEGRMKGQAFVALPSEEVASSALKDTNGFLLKEKPMVVQFARSAKAQEDGSSKP